MTMRSAVACALVLTVCAVPASSAEQPTWRAPDTVVSSTDKPITDVVAFVDPRGTQTLVWLQGFSVMTAERSASARGWSRPRRLEACNQPTDVAGQANAAGTVVVAWRCREEVPVPAAPPYQRFRIAAALHVANSGWEQAVTVGDYPIAEPRPQRSCLSETPEFDIGVDARGRATIVWVDDARRAWVAERSDSSWTVATPLPSLETPPANCGIDLEVDPAGQAAAVWGDGTLAERRIGEAWREMPPLPPATDHVGRVLARTASGALVGGWSERGGDPSTLFEARTSTRPTESSAWKPPVILGPGIATRLIRMRPGGVLATWVNVLRGNETLFSRTSNGASWQPSGRLSSGQASLDEPGWQIAPFGDGALAVSILVSGGAERGVNGRVAADYLPTVRSSWEPRLLISLPQEAPAVAVSLAVGSQGDAVAVWATRDDAPSSERPPIFGLSASRFSATAPGPRLETRSLLAGLELPTSVAQQALVRVTPAFRSYQSPVRVELQEERAGRFVTVQREVASAGRAFSVRFTQSGLRRFRLRYRSGGSERTTKPQVVRVTRQRERRVPVGGIPIDVHVQGPNLWIIAGERGKIRLELRDAESGALRRGISIDPTGSDLELVGVGSATWLRGKASVVLDPTSPKLLGQRIAGGGGSGFAVGWGSQGWTDRGTSIDATTGRSTGRSLPGFTDTLVAMGPDALWTARYTLADESGCVGTLVRRDPITGVEIGAGGEAPALGSSCVISREGPGGVATPGAFWLSAGNYLRRHLTSGGVQTIGTGSWDWYPPKYSDGRIWALRTESVGTDLLSRGAGLASFAAQTGQPGKVVPLSPDVVKAMSFQFGDLAVAKKFFWFAAPEEGALIRIPVPQNVKLR
jgi:hypothetical protein